jgi:hypothetical protein
MPHFVKRHHFSSPDFSVFTSSNSLQGGESKPVLIALPANPAIRTIEFRHGVFPGLPVGASSNDLNFGFRIFADIRILDIDIPPA